MKVIHVYNQSMVFDIRTRRYAKSITDFFAEVDFLLVGQREGQAENVEVLSDRAKILRIAYNRNINKAIAHLAWSIRVFRILLLEKKVRVISAHSLKVLPICLLATLVRRNCILLYDTHEIETHTTSNKLLSKLLTWLERICMSFVNQIIVTSPGHEKWYKHNYNKPVHLIRNTPGIAETPENINLGLKKSLSIPDSDVLFIYIGMIAKRRGCEVILKAFDGVKNKHILFLGYGDYLDELILTSEGWENVHILDPVSPLELVEFISGADVGIHMMDDSNLNHRKALPNKPMQYMSAGLACIVSDVEVMSMLIRDANSGIVVKVGAVDELNKVVESMTFENMKTYKANASRWFESNNWEKESFKLKELYKNLLLIKS